MVSGNSGHKLSGVQTRDNQGRVMDAPSRHWVYRFLPHFFWPYAQLARWDRPIGWQLLMWPCWWAVGLAAVSKGDTSSVSTLLWYLFLFFVGAVAMRGAGCTYNDLVDQKIDEAVERTRSRPLPSGQVSRVQAKIFLVIQSLIGLAVLLQFNTYTIILGLCSLIIVALYPFMKRVTDWPQLFLGFAFNWGALMGWSAINGSLSLSPILLYVGAVCWTIGYDTIYAHQDKEDDAIVGVRSTARLFGSKTKPALIWLYGIMLAFAAASFAVAGVPLVTTIGLLLAAMHMFYQIKVLDIDNGDQCLKLFKSNSMVGLLIFLGFVIGGFWIAI